MPDDDEEYQRELSFSHWGGHASALEGAAINARNSAGQAFALNKDQLAEFWRQTAVWLENLAADARKNQKKYEKRFSGGI